MAAPASKPPQDVVALVRAETASALRLALLVGGTATLATFATIFLKMEVYRLVIPTGSIPTAIGLAAGFTLVAALLVGMEHLRDAALVSAGSRLARRLSGPAVLAAAARAGDPAASAGALLADVEEVRRAISGPLCTAVLDAVLVPSALLVLWALNPWFAVLAATACAVAALTSVAAERHARRSLAASNAGAGRTSGLVADAMRCAEAVEAMGMRPALVRRWLAGLREGNARMGEAQELGRRLTASLGALTSLSAGGAMLLGAALSLRGEDLGIGLMIAMLLTGRVIEPFARFGTATADWGRAAAAWSRLRATAGRDGAAHAAYPCPEGRLVLERLTYLHPGTPRPMLREVDLAVLPGEVVAITGAPGSGKTTLLRLMLGMHRPTAGGVFLDGHATSRWDREDLARHVGYLPQNPDLGEGTVAEAIARLAPDPDPRAVLRAARLSGADRMIVGLPLGYATPVGGSGESGLSAGQRQRVALARAVFGAPRLLLLDEPASWLDAEGEAAVVATLGRLREAGVAVVLTTHRPGVLAAADRVLSLSGATLRPVPRPSGVVVPLGAKGAA